MGAGRDAEEHPTNVGDAPAFKDHRHDGAPGHFHDEEGDHAHMHKGRSDGTRNPLRLIARLVSMLGHGHSRAVDAQMISAERGIRAVKISLVALLATAAFQLAVVALSGSVALLADTVHNFADALTALPLWLAFRLGRRLPNRRYTYGYGRAEDLAGVLIVAIIAGSAVFTGWQSVQRLLHPRPIADLGWVATAALIGLVGNELVALYRIRVGRQIGSAALVADGLHARTDGFTSLGVLVGAAGVAAGWEQADPVMGLVITVAIMFVVKQAARDVYFRLMEVVSPELVDKAEKVLAQTPGVEGVEDLRMRWIGHRLRAEAKVTVDCESSLEEAHRIVEDAHHALLHATPSLEEAVIHVNPCNHKGEDHHAGIAHHFRARI